MARRSSSPRQTRRPATPAIDAGLRYLGRRAHSRVELRRKLERKGYGQGEVEAAMARLGELGYLDDAAFARAVVRRRSSARGPRALAAELAAKGIDRAGIDAALGEAGSEVQLEAAMRLAERLYAGMPSGDYRDLLNRIGAKLVRRGFSSDVARAACRAVLLGQADGAGA